MSEHERESGDEESRCELEGKQVGPNMNFVAWVGLDVLDRPTHYCQ